MPPTPPFTLAHFLSESRHYLGLINPLNVWSREAGIDLIDVLQIHVFRHRVLVQVEGQAGTGKNSIHLQREREELRRRTLVFLP